jgi:hypothetical protein
MYRPQTRTIAIPVAVHHPGHNNVVPFRKKSAQAVELYRRGTEESEALLAALSMGAILLIVLVSLAMKLWVG